MTRWRATSPAARPAEREAGSGTQTRRRTRPSSSALVARARAKSCAARRITAKGVGRPVSRRPRTCPMRVRSMRRPAARTPLCRAGRAATRARRGRRATCDTPTRPRGRPAGRDLSMLRRSTAGCCTRGCALLRSWRRAADTAWDVRPVGRSGIRDLERGSTESYPTITSRTGPPLRCVPPALLTGVRLALLG